MDSGPHIYKVVGHFNIDMSTKGYLGKGSFGQVYKAYDSFKNNEVVAAKIIPNKFLADDAKFAIKIQRELDILYKLKGKGVVSLLGVYQTASNLYIFMDYCDGGDLEGKIRSRALTEKESVNIIESIVDAFLTMDDLKNANGDKITVLHRDIKPANILFHKNSPKLADFGFSKAINAELKDQKLPQTLLGTPMYMSPQILNDETYGYKTDVWSTGVVFYECLFRTPPWTGRNYDELYTNIQTKSLTFPKAVSDETKDLVKRMLAFEEKDRLDWKEIKAHPVFLKFR